MDLLRPLAWIGVGILSLAGLYVAARTVFRAYYKSKMEFHDELRRKQDDESV